MSRVCRCYGGEVWIRVWCVSVTKHESCIEGRAHVYSRTMTDGLVTGAAHGDVCVVMLILYSLLQSGIHDVDDDDGDDEVNNDNSNNDNNNNN